MNILELESLIKECLIKLKIGHISKENIYLNFFSESNLGFTIEKGDKDYKINCRIEKGVLDPAFSEIETKIKKSKSIKDLLT